MNIFLQTLIAALSGIFIENAVFERALGVNILLYAAKKRDNLIGLFAGIIYITTLSSVATYFVDSACMELPYYKILMPFIYILIVSVVYVASLVLVWRFLPRVFKRVKKYVHLSVFNCAVLGALFLQSALGTSLASYIGYGIGTGLGFLLAGYLLHAASDRLNSEYVPAAFRGMPIMIIYVGVISLALSAFIGS